uniref:Transposable element P transposase-like RNase H C-terminal domain-containing protein n=1 Tax=Phlebotomus papatasi TaxID=29031 RepID=A0A1B0DKW1_PHLPP
MFFGAVRTRLGSNTNPSVIQFRAAYKRLVTHVQIEARKGNCLSGSEQNTTNIDFHTEQDEEREIRIIEDIDILNTDEVTIIEEHISEALESVLEN